MIKNKAIHAMIIGTCVFAGSIVGVYADTTAADTPVSIQIEQVSASDPLMQKQNEIDQYVFESNAKDFAGKDITVTNTGVIGDYVEVGIAPFNTENANYIYEIFGKDQVKVVEGIQATTLELADSSQDVTVQLQSYPPEIAEAQVISAPVEKEYSPVVSFFSNIWEWVKNIF